MADTSHTRVTLTVDGPELVVAAVEVVLQADWTYVLESMQGDLTVFTVDVAEPALWLQPVPAFLRDAEISGQLVAKSAEAPNHGARPRTEELPMPDDSAAELLVKRLAEHYRVELDHEESDVLSHDVRVQAVIFPGRHPDGRAAYK